MYTDLQTFVTALERSGELVRISEPVSPVLEISAIADRVSQSKAPRRASSSAIASDPRFHDRGGPALLFESVEGSDFPVLINAFGSYSRMELALGCARFAGQDGPDGFEAIACRIAELLRPEPPKSLSDAIQTGRRLLPLLRIGPGRLNRPGPSQQVVRTGADIDLTRIPILKCWPLDGQPESVGYPIQNADGQEHPAISSAQWNQQFRGRYITLAGVHTIHANDRSESRPGSHNIGMYRLQLLGQDRLGMHWHMHHDGAAHWRSWKKLGQPMPVAVALGGPSVLPYAATCPLPPGVSELLMAGFLQGRGIRLCKAKTVPLWVPADAEIIIEGFVRTDAGFPDWDPRDPEAGSLGPGAVFEGPFGDHTGFYSLPDRYPIMEVTAITSRRNAIYPTTIVGLPPQEDYYLGKATERIMKPLLATVAPDIQDYDLPLFGAFHNCAFVQIDKAFPLHAHRVASSIWGAGQMSWTKMIFVVDSDVDVHDAFAVLERAGIYCDPERDIVRNMGPLDILDHAAPWLGAGGKVAFDATRKIESEQLIQAPRSPARSFDQTALDEIVRTIAGVSGVNEVSSPAQARGWAFVSTSSSGFDQVEALVGRVREALQDLDEPPVFVVILGPEVDIQDPDQSMFHLCANTDFARDLSVVQAGGGRSVAIMDATAKAPETGYPLPTRSWPPILKMDPKVVQRVAERWSSLGLGQI